MQRPLRIVLIADTFPPLRTSGAVQLRDLSREFSRQGHQLTVMLPTASLLTSWKLDTLDGAQILRLRAPKTKDINYVQRTIGEFLMPFFMRYNLNRSPLANEKWDGVVWYAPSIFFGPFANFLRKQSSCKSYLIIRDIFPDWAADMGLMTRGGLPYKFFSAVARYQYSVADVIGVQTPGNLAYFQDWLKLYGRKLEVLQNWLDQPIHSPCPIRVSETALAGRTIFVYAGNIGVAQGIDIFLELASRLTATSQIGFLFVGRGSEAQRLKNVAQARGLTNILFFDEIDPDAIPDLYSQCHAGIVALDPRHSSHNIPGKFLTYMQNGLPVLANVNAGNDIASMIRLEKVGEVCESNQLDALVELALKLTSEINVCADLSVRCRTLFAREFSAKQKVHQLINALTQ